MKPSALTANWIWSRATRPSSVSHAAGLGCQDEPIDVLLQEEASVLQRLGRGADLAT
jgi:hypothetical protein